MTRLRTIPPDVSSSATRSDRWMTFLLRAASGLSVALIVVGLGVSLWRHPQYATSSASLADLIATNASFPHTPSTVIAGLATGRGQAIVVLGLLVLMVTPIMRVGVSVLGFLELRDWPFAAISVILLTILLVSLALGSAG